MPTRYITVALDHGQIDQNLKSRVDSSVYANGLLLADNWAPLPQGGITRRPAFVEEPNAGCLDDRIVAWEFDENERYIFSLGQTAMNFYRIQSDFSVDWVQGVQYPPAWPSVTPQTLHDLEISIRYDTAILCHRSLRPMIITRTSANTFEAAEFTFSDRFDTKLSQAPTFKFAAAPITMQPCDASGNGILEVKEDDTVYWQFFNADQVTGLPYDASALEAGSVIRYANALIDITVEADGNNRVQGICRQDIPRTQRIGVTYDGADSWLLHETVVCAEDNGEGLLVGWTDTTLDIVVLRGQFATPNAVVTGAESQVSVEIDGNQTPAWIEHAPITWWEESVYSNYRGWFGTVAFYQQRMWVAGSWDMPAMICASKVQDFYNFDVADGTDTDAIQVILAADNPGQIRSLLAARHLQIFTTTGEHYIAEDETSAITAATVSVRSSSNFGIGFASPQVFAGFVYFVPQDNRQIRVNSWDDIQQQYLAPPMGFMHEDLLTSIRTILPAYSKSGEPAQYLYCLQNDGTLVVIFSIPLEGTNMGFWPWKAAQPIKSIAQIDNRLFLLSNNFIQRARDGMICELPSVLETTVLTIDWPEGTSRGRYIRQGKIEIENRNTSRLVINGREQVPKALDERIDHYQFGWTRDPKIRIEVNELVDATILSIMQEVSM